MSLTHHINVQRRIYLYHCPKIEKAHRNSCLSLRCHICIFATVTLIGTSRSRTHPQALSRLALSGLQLITSSQVSHNCPLLSSCSYFEGCLMFTLAPWDVRMTPVTSVPYERGFITRHPLTLFLCTKLTSML
jgi:hypothetical protein